MTKKKNRNIKLLGLVIVISSVLTFSKTTILRSFLPDIRDQTTLLTTTRKNETTRLSSSGTGKSPLLAVPEPPTLGSISSTTGSTFRENAYIRGYPPYEKQLTEFWKSFLLSDELTDERTAGLALSARQQLKFLERTMVIIRGKEDAQNRDAQNRRLKDKRQPAMKRQPAKALEERNRDRAIARQPDMKSTTRKPERKQKPIPTLEEDTSLPGIERIFSFDSLLPKQSEKYSTKNGNTNSISHPNLLRHLRQFRALPIACYGNYHVIPLANEDYIDKNTDAIVAGNCPNATTHDSSNIDVGFLHIWKNGGTIFEHQCNTLNDGLTYRANVTSLFALVRDPIEHFLSGWSECEWRDLLDYRRKHGLKKGNAYLSHLTSLTYDERIQSFVKKTKRHYLTTQNCGRPKHAFPQANFFLDPSIEEYGIRKQYHLDPRLRFVGHLSELKEVLHALLPSYARFFEDNPPKKSKSTYQVSGTNNSTENPLKNTYFSRKTAMESISDKTLQSICDFVAIDYYLFDFEVPKACLVLFD